MKIGYKKSSRDVDKIKYPKAIILHKRRKQKRKGVIGSSDFSRVFREKWKGFVNIIMSAFQGTTSNVC